MTHLETELEAAQEAAANAKPLTESEAHAELAALRPLKTKVRQLQEKAKSHEIRIQNLRITKEKEVHEANVITSRSRLGRELAQYKADLEVAEKHIRKLEVENEEYERERDAIRAFNTSAVPNSERIQFGHVSAREQLGIILVNSGVITQNELSEVIAESRRTGGRT